MTISVVGALVAFFVLTGGAGHASAPEFPTLQADLTAYNAVPGQTDDSPLYTAIGAYSNPEIVAARSRDLAATLPYGTVIEVVPTSDSPTCGYNEVKNLVGYRVIADTMAPQMHNRVDVLLPNAIDLANRSANPALLLGLCEGVTVKIVGKIDVSNPKKLPSTQEALAAMVGASGLAVNTK